MMLLAFRINSTTVQILKNIAHREGTTLSNVIRQAIADYLDKLIKKS